VANEKSIGDVVRELVELLRAYAKQEVTEPFGRLKHYLTFGLGGAVLLGLGLSFISLGILRTIQHLAWTEDGYGSLVPYLGMIVFQVIVMVVCGLKIKSSMAGKGVGPSGSTMTTKAEEVLS
jgi:hypothetical protein